MVRAALSLADSSNFKRPTSARPVSYNGRRCPCVTIADARALRLALHLSVRNNYSVKRLRSTSPSFMCAAYDVQLPLDWSLFWPAPAWYGCIPSACYLRTVWMHVLLLVQTGCSARAGTAALRDCAERGSVPTLQHRRLTNRHPLFRAELCSLRCTAVVQFDAYA